MTMTMYVRQEKPKRCLTAYNIFFRDERERLLETLPVRENVKKGHGKICFAELAREIARAWKRISPACKVAYCEQACQDKVRYYREMEEWRAAERIRVTEGTDDQNYDQNSVANVSSASMLTESSMARNHHHAAGFDESRTTQNHREERMPFNFGGKVPETSDSMRITTTEELVGRVELAIFPHGRPFSHQIRHSADVMTLH